MQSVYDSVFTIVISMATNFRKQEYLQRIGMYVRILRKMSNNNLLRRDYYQDNARL